MEAPERREAGDMPLPGGHFQLFIQKLSYQALLGLGVLENPLTGKREERLDQARGVIDDVAMLRDRTRGNLSEEEASHLDRVIEQLEAEYARRAGSAE
ncbi:MAG TPA: DUF1844 domain-containing protein [Planctomycetes bacterium]|nr:DUF1844 domain-containing protein [Planctomycetota bacterium]